MEERTRSARQAAKLALLLAIACGLWLPLTGVAAAAETVVFSDTFENPSSLWQVNHATGPYPENTSYSWKAVDWGIATIWSDTSRPHTAYCGAVHNEYPAYDPDSKWSNKVPSPAYNQMVAGPFDLSGATSAKLVFDSWCALTIATYDVIHNEWQKNDEFCAVYTTDGGQSYTEKEFGRDLLASGWRTCTLDLTPACGKKEVYVGFTYLASLSSINEGAYVDDVELVVTGGTAVAPDTGKTTKTEVSGATRIGTAIAASKAAYPNTAPGVVIATAYNFPDALGGSSFAGVIDSPLLLTAKDSLPPEVVDEIKRLKATQAVILGGEAAVGPGVAAQLASLMGGTDRVTRLGGTDRYDTAARIARATVDGLKAKGASYDGSVFIATGENFPDALAASPIAAKKCWPILLSRGTMLPDTTKAALTAIGAKRAMLLGSEAALSSGVSNEAGAVTGGSPTRLAGPNRYRTAIAIAEYGVTQGLGWNGLAFATGSNYPDALSGGVMCAKLGSVMLLTPPDALDPNVASALRTHKDAITQVRYLGSTSAISSSARSAIAGCLN